MRLNQIMRGCSNYFKHAVAKHIMSSLENFVWHRVIRCWKKLHRWRWKDVRRHHTGRNGRWVRPSADGVELFNLAKVPITRHRYRGAQIPNPLDPGQPRPTADTVESPLRGNSHGGCGERPWETDRRQPRHRAQGRLNHRHRHALGSATRRFRPGACVGMAEMAYYRCRSWWGWPDWTAPAGTHTPRRIRGVVI